MGTGARRAATLRDVKPPLVSVTMSGVRSIRATALVPSAMASSTETVAPGVARRSSRPVPTPAAGPWRSISLMMRSIPPTPSSGWAPTAGSGGGMNAGGAAPNPLGPPRRGGGRVLAVLLGERRRGPVQAGQVHALVRREGPAVLDPALHPRRRDARDLDREQAVVEQDAGPRPDVGGEVGVGRRQLVAAGDLLGGEHDRFAGHELARLGQLAHADARALQIPQHR